MWGVCVFVVCCFFLFAERPFCWLNQDQSQYTRLNFTALSLGSSSRRESQAIPQEEEEDLVSTVQQLTVWKIIPCQIPTVMIDYQTETNRSRSIAGSCCPRWVWRCKISMLMLMVVRRHVTIGVFLSKSGTLNGTFRPWPPWHDVLTSIIVLVIVLCQRRHNCFVRSGKVLCSRALGTGWSVYEVRGGVGRSLRMLGTGYGVSVGSLVYRMIWEAIAGQLAHDGHDRGLVYELVDVAEITELLEKRLRPLLRRNPLRRCCCGEI